MAFSSAPTVGPDCSHCGSRCDRATGPAASKQGLPVVSFEGPTVLLAGNPNAGKTTLFNALSGARARVGNYPGVTVDRRSALVALPSGERFELVDLPGTYSVTARSPEEQISADAVLGRGGEHPDAVVVVLDATAMARSLYLALQVLESGAPTVLALNMMDEASAAGTQIDHAQLAERLGVPVVPMTASRGEGVRELVAAVERVLHEPPTPAPQLAMDAEVEASVERMQAAIRKELPDLCEAALRPWALWLLLSISDDDELIGIPESLRDAARREQVRAHQRGDDLDLQIIATRYAHIDALAAETLREGEAGRRSLTDRIDSVLTHPVSGIAVFGLVMVLVFEALFSWAEPAMGLVEEAIAWSQGLVVSLMGAGIVRDALTEGVIQGVGNVLVFVPQIALLFLFVTFLEDCGYLARVAFIIDPIMSRLGLHGRAFVPLLAGFACAVPAVMATRTIETRRDRLITMLALPLMSCSARLPVYVLIVGTVFAGHARVLGVLSAGAVALFAMYAISVLATLGVAFVLGRTVLPGRRPALVLELPPYRMPVAKNLATATLTRVNSFVREAGSIILVITVILWGLLTFPQDAELEQQYTREHRALVQQAADEEALEGLDRHHAMLALEHSFAGRVGKALEPAIEPLGYDWRIGVGILGAFAAREVFVSTLAMVFGIADGDGEGAPLRAALHDARRSDGSKLMTPLTGVSLMIFFVLACQCMSTIAVVRRESGSWRWPALMLGYMTALAYGAALLVYQVGSALGWGLA